ncbi:MAG: response regulator [Alphaproteobacteria bacterium]|uniref:Response regulator n=1 Tax=Candidatus Nitrobium versatile TaxID=2884831 RepID=A0A953J948_9BACT|nr:response regulator [Candidatus Nitrobium versatile]
MTPVKVLVADGTPSLRECTREGLEKSCLRIEVHEAGSGREARAKLESGGFDLVLCGGEMPDMKGHELLQWIRNHPVLKDIPFILLAEKGDRDEVVRAIHAGVNGYVVKPFTIEALLQKMAGVDDRFDRRRSGRFEMNGEVTFHFEGGAARGVLVDLSTGGVLALLASRGPLPRILERVLIDIRLDNGLSTAGLKGFIIRIQAAEAFQSSDQVKFAVKFQENDEGQVRELKHLVRSLSEIVS